MEETGVLEKSTLLSLVLPHFELGPILHFYRIFKHLYISVQRPVNQVEFRRSKLLSGQGCGRGFTTEAAVAKPWGQHV